MEKITSLRKYFRNMFKVKTIKKQCSYFTDYQCYQPENLIFPQNRLLSKTRQGSKCLEFLRYIILLEGDIKTIRLKIWSTTKLTENFFDSGSSSKIIENVCLPLHVCSIEKLYCFFFINYVKIIFPIPTSTMQWKI